MKERKNESTQDVIVMSQKYQANDRHVEHTIDSGIEYQ
jgi:hypothetical protein